MLSLRSKIATKRSLQAHFRSLRINLGETRICLTKPFSSSPSSSPTEPFYGLPRQGSRTPLSPLQSIAIAIYSAATAYADPERHDMVAALSEVTGDVALRNMHREMMASDTGRRILSDRPLVNLSTIDIPALMDLPPTTFGHAYASFLDRHGFDPDKRAEVQYVAGEDLAYVMTRYRQSHDFYHVLTDLPPTIPGELALKYAELFQTGLPACALSATVGSWMLKEEERREWREAYLPWAIRVGKDANIKWMNVYWEEEFEKDLIDLRKELGAEVAPII